MSGMKPASWSYAEEFVPEPEVVEAARRRGVELGTAPPIGAGAGAVLRLLAAVVGRPAVVEIGTGTGHLRALAAARDARADGVLTTVDIEAEHQRAARQAFTTAGYPHQRTRVITGAAAEVLPRLTDGATTWCFVDGDKETYPTYLEHALRLLRPGGVVAFDNMLWHDQVADPAARDDTTSTLRELGKELRDHDDLVTVLLPVSDGLLVAVRR